MNEYNNLLKVIVDSILNSNLDNISLTRKLKNILDVNFYILLLNLNKKEYKYQIDKEEELVILEFIRLLNNYKVQVELNRRPVHLEESASKVLDCFYKNENILLNYLSDNVGIEDMLISTDIKEVDDLIIDLSCKKKEKDNNNVKKNKKIMEYSKLLNSNKYSILDDKIITNKEKIDIDELKDLFSFLLNVDNYEFSYKNVKIKNLQLNIVNDIIDNINSKEININKISKVIIPLLLNRISYINKSELLDGSNFKIENISISDLLSNKNNEIKNNMSRVSFKNNDIALSNSYLLDKIIKIFNLGKYYFIEDNFIVEDKDFKCSIVINKMIDCLINLI